MRLRNGHLVAMTAALVGMSCLLSAGGVLAWSRSALSQVSVEVGSVDLSFVDKKGKGVKLGPKALLDPGETLDRFKNGYVKTTLGVEVTNAGSLPLEVHRVDYTVKLNGFEAGEGTFPGEGKGPVTLEPGSPYKTTIKLKTPTKKVLKGDLTKLLRGGEVVVEVEGEAEGAALGLRSRQRFETKRTASYP